MGFLGSPVEVIDVPGLQKTGAMGIMNTIVQVVSFGAVAAVGGLASNFFVNQVQGMLPDQLNGAYTRPVLHVAAAAVVFGAGWRFWPGTHKKTAALALAVPAMLQASAGVIKALWKNPPQSNTTMRTIYDTITSMAGYTDDMDDGMQDYLQVDGDGGADSYGVEDYLQVDGIHEAGMGAMYEAGMGDHAQEEAESEAASPF